MATAQLQQLLDEYGESHQNGTNKFIHWICVPVIFFTVVALIWSIPFPFAEAAWINWATVLLLPVHLYYWRLSPQLMVAMLLFSLACCALCAVWSTTMPLWQFALMVFVAAWVGQFIGHKIEGKKPSFFKDVFFLLIGPAWLMHFIFHKLGVRY
ncbi:DUF962 domain-containing protein [Neiella marina]|uniref:DUF962 domain-containing protein n=1 Tax=Neiella holothuriorum TaxID=2870530 RepID=A0ABS7EJT6_9GAMM|nr:Mpo1-like protein [Neiella holothuriorum]MBW8192618.1 DUF962 domain-containing protein [Neiella holothuriorum]